MRLHHACLASALMLGGCQLLLATDRAQCAVDADCAQKAGQGLVCMNEVCVAAANASSPEAGAEEAGLPKDDGTPWGCLASPPARPAEDRSRPLMVRQRFVAFSLLDCIHEKPIPGVEVKLCSPNDIMCASPIETAVSDCDGYVTLTAFYHGFKGWVLALPPRPTTAGGAEPRWPTVVETCYREQLAKEAAEGKSGERCAVQRDGHGDPIVGLPGDLASGAVQALPSASGDDPTMEIPVSRALHLMSDGTLRGLVGVIGQTLDEKAGHLFALALDCQGKVASGVSITSSGGIGQRTQGFYMDAQGLPDANRTETSHHGEVGYVNLAAGEAGVDVVTVTATHHATRQRIGTYPTLVRSGFITYLALAPLKD